MKQAMSCGCAAKAASACASARRSASATAATAASSYGKWIAGTSMRGQSNFGKRSVFTGSVLVSESV